MGTVQSDKRTGAGGGRGGRGHKPKKRVRQRGHTRAICRRCGERGHIGRNCMLAAINASTASNQAQPQPRDQTTEHRTADTAVVVEGEASPSLDNGDLQAVSEEVSGESEEKLADSEKK
ncbi:hypothetical protein FSARC_8692 [Fusarium sarcochroum]|uniref:CCHC-type domain-containing protein n=1 Tax=Fusarium sarcochroum TaxID=1208366 RepID=A0A8H4X6P9_9HYPO|nr:hypothetical protein FSARC_8692 [Fusarium sarcochroum]